MSDAECPPNASSMRTLNSTHLLKTDVWDPRMGPGRRSELDGRSRKVSWTVVCVLLLLTTSLVTKDVAASSPGGGGSGGAFNNSTAPPFYPYVVPSTAFPKPASLTTSQTPTGAAITPLLGSMTAYGVLLAMSNGSTFTLVYRNLTFSPIDAKSIFQSGSCGPNCGQLPLNWSNPTTVATFTAPILAVRLTTMGSTVIAVASSGASTYLYSRASSPGTWGAFGQPITGLAESVAATSDEVAVATLISNNIYVTTLTSGGVVVGSGSISLSGGGQYARGASLAFVPSGSIFVEEVAVSVALIGQVQLSSSRDGVHFSTASFVANYSLDPSDSPIPSVGSTAVNAIGGTPGIVQLANVGSQLFLLFATNLSGQTVPATMSTANLGGNWSGPFMTGPVNGSVSNPALAVGPTGLVYCVWADPDFDAGALDEAVYLPDGQPIGPPQMIQGSDSTSAGTPSSSPAIAVDDLARPIYVWAAGSNATQGVSYTGGYPIATVALNLSENASAASLGLADLADGGRAGPSELSSLEGAINASAAKVSQNITSSNLCQTQNDTALYLYPNLTHLPLTFAAGAGTLCATGFPSRTSVSTIMPSVGLDAPNTYLAVTSDWLLQSEGFPLTQSPFASTGQFGPYEFELPSSTLAVSNSTSEVVQSKTVTLTATPSPYSPTAYQLAVSDQFPSWSGTSGASKCSSTAHIDYSNVTSVSQTWTNVSINNATPAHSFTGTTSYPSVWIYGLEPYQVYGWSATFAARTSQTETIVNECTGHISHVTTSPGSPASVPTMSLNGGFSTALADTYTGAYITAAYNNGHSAAKITASFGASLPVESTITLANSTATQSWTSTIFQTGLSHTFTQYSGVGQTYTLGTSSTTRLGNATSPGLPSFAVASPQSTTSEGVWSSCTFALGSSLPTIWAPSGHSYWANGTSTVDVSWLSNETAEGFFTYHEQGSMVNETISNITPISLGGGVWNYTTEVHGLVPSLVYGGTYGLSWAEGCVTDQAGVSIQSFASGNSGGDPVVSLASKISMWERDLSYDSISRSGGGIQLSWNNPVSAGTKGKVTNGTVTVYNPANRSETWDVPIEASQVSQPKHALGTYPLNVLNLSLPLDSNTVYDVSLGMNYSTHPKVPVYDGTAFTYHKSWTRDGLTDAEKEAGWNVSIQPCAGVSDASSPLCGIRERGQVTRFSTNGLANDYFEKELGLNPNTIDTASSDMLDLWNLTFSLTNNSATQRVPTGIKVWWENSSYVPFSTPLFPGGPALAGVPYASGMANISCTIRSCPGNTSWSAGVVWSYQALQQFTRTTGYTSATSGANYLRAVGGTWSGLPVITLWGKLSWGANPLISSTINNGVADGARVDPTHLLYLVLNYTYLQVSMGLSQSQPFTWAVDFYVNGSVSGPQRFTIIRSSPSLPGPVWNRPPTSLLCPSMTATHCKPSRHLSWAISELLAAPTFSRSHRLQGVHGTSPTLTSFAGPHQT